MLRMITVQLVNDRVNTEETATSVLDHQSHAAGNEAIAEEDEGTETGASAGHEAMTAAAHSDTVTYSLVTYAHTWLLFSWLVYAGRAWLKPVMAAV